MGRTKIDWTDYSIGGAKMGLFGCYPVHSGCAHCWSPGMFRRFEQTWGVPAGIVKGGKWTGKVEVNYRRIHQAFADLPKRGGLRVFAPSNVDLFHPDVPDHFILQAIGLMSRRPDLTFQILTKRPERIVPWLDWAQCGPWVPNIWIGCSCSKQDDVDRMVPELLKVPAAVRFLSLEPLLGPIDLEMVARNFDGFPGCDNFLTGEWWPAHGGPSFEEEAGKRPRFERGIDWVIVGAESGPSRRACLDEWIRKIIRQCEDADVPTFVKQLDKRDGVMRNTSIYWPSWAVQEFPEVSP